MIQLSRAIALKIGISDHRLQLVSKDLQTSSLRTTKLTLNNGQHEAQNKAV